MDKPPIKCRKPSRCYLCGADMRRGQPIRKVSGRWQHDGCGDD